MKKIIITASFVLACALSFISCEKEIEKNVNGQPLDGVAFTITLNPGTKTAIDGISTSWVAGDKINIFHAVAGTTDYVNDGAFEITNASTGTATGTLAEPLVDSNNYDWYAFYPYDASNASPAAINLVVPTEQVQAESGSRAHICGNLDPLYGKSAAVAGSSSPTINMDHLLTVVKIRARNYNFSTLSLSTVSFSAKSINGGADVNLAGSFKLDVTGSEPAFTPVAPVVRPYVSLTSPASLNTNDYAYAYVAVVPFVINHAGEYTVGMNNTTGGITMALYGTQGGLVQFKAGHIKEVRQGTENEPPFKDGINFYKGYLMDGAYVNDDWGAWRVDLPADYQLSGEFSFEDLLYSCNIGDARVSPASDGNGGSNVNGKGYDACVVNNGTAGNFYWRRNARFGHNFEDTWYPARPDYKHGLLMDLYCGYRVCGGGKLMWFRMADPFEGLVISDPNDANIKGISCPSLITPATGWASAPNYAIGSHQPGETKDIVTDFIELNAGWSGDNNPLFTSAWNALDIQDAAGNTLIYTDDTHHIALSDPMAAYCRQSKGLYWAQTWYNYEPAWQDGGMNDPGVATAAARGITLTEDGKIVASSSFNPTVDGGYRITSRVALQTDYADFTFIGTRWMVMTTYYLGI